MPLGINSETVKNVAKFKTPVLRDCFTSKYVTAQIMDEGGGWNCVPLVQKYMHNDHVFVKLGDKVIMLKVDMTAIHTYRQAMSRPIQTLFYTTQDYSPFIPADIKKTENFCKDNGITQLGPVQAMFIHAASLLERKDKKGKIIQQSIQMSDVIDSLTATLNPESEDYVKQCAELNNAANDLGTSELMTPIKPMSDILDKKMHNNPESLASGYDSLRRANFEWKKIASPARTPFGHWALVIGMIGVIGLIAGIAFAYDSGMFGSGSSALDELLEKAQEFTDPADYLANKTGADTTADAVDKITEEANAVPTVTEKIDVPAVTEKTEVPDVSEKTEVPVVESIVVIPDSASEVIVTEKTEVPVVPKLDSQGIVDYFNSGSTDDGWVIDSMTEVNITGSGSLLDEELTESTDLSDYGLSSFPDYSRAFEYQDKITYYTQGNDTEIDHDVNTNNDELNDILEKERVVEKHYHDNFNPESGMFDKEIIDDTKSKGEFIQDFN